MTESKKEEIEEIYFFEMNTKYISSSELKTSNFHECVARVKILMFSNHEMCEITVPVNHYDVITFHWKSFANPRWNYTGNGRILRGSAAIRGGIKIFRGGIISGQVSGIAGGSEKSSAGVGGLVKIPLDCTVYDAIANGFYSQLIGNIRTSLRKNARIIYND